MNEYYRRPSRKQSAEIALGFFWFAFIILLIVLLAAKN